MVSKLLLIRHGEAEPCLLDPNEPLSTKGRSQVKQLVLFLMKKELKIDLILHSPKLRAKQTAELIAEKQKQAPTLEKRNMGPNDPIEQFPLDWQETVVALVGHLPFLESLLCFLLFEKEVPSFIEMRTACAIFLKKEERWKIEELFNPL